MRFATEGSLSKWGFGDGDILDDLLWDHNIRDTPPGFAHRVLIAVVREHVLPVIDQTLDVYEIETIHNPIRTESVDGVEIDPYEEPIVALTPEYVDVPDATILAIARRALAGTESPTQHGEERK